MSLFSHFSRPYDLVYRPILPSFFVTIFSRLIAKFEINEMASNQSFLVGKQNYNLLFPTYQTSFALDESIIFYLKFFS